MPNRKAHTAITLGVAALSLASLPLVGKNEIPLVLGILSTLPFRVFGTSVYLNPDMDIKMNRGKLSILLGVDAYRRAVGHRMGLRKSDWNSLRENPFKILLFSHAPFVGTLVRFLPVALAIFIFSFIIQIGGEIYLWWFVGMGLSDTGHVVSDLAVSRLKL